MLATVRVPSSAGDVCGGWPVYGNCTLTPQLTPACACRAYLSDLLHRVSDITSRCCLRSSVSSYLVIPLSWLVTVGDQSFAVAGPRLWNTLPEDITSVLSSLVIR